MKELISKYGPRKTDNIFDYIMRDADWMDITKTVILSISNEAINVWEWNMRRYRNGGGNYYYWTEISIDLPSYKIKNGTYSLMVRDLLGSGNGLQNADKTHVEFSQRTDVTEMPAPAGDIVFNRDGLLGHIVFRKDKDKNEDGSVPRLYLFLKLQ